jgi:hypothetical protein
MVAEDASAAAHTSVRGTIYDRAPLDELVQVVSTVGDCELLKPVVAFCEETCSASTESCTKDGKCATNPIAIDVGTLTLKDVKLSDGRSSFSMTTINSNYLPKAADKLDYPPCEAGKDVTLSGSIGGKAIEVVSTCNEPLELGGSDPLPFVSGTPLELEWTKPSIAGRTHISVEIDISHHAGLKGLIRCTTADTGSLTVDASLVTALIALGTAGYPEVRVTRSALGSTTVGEGHLDLDIYSINTRFLSIPGYSSCSSSEDCPTDKPTCNQDLLCE